MRNFFKMFGACLLALVIFSAITFFFVIGYVGGLASKSIPRVKEKSVLVLDLGNYFQEQKQQNPLSLLNNDNNIPGLYDVIRMIGEAKKDKDIEGIYVIANRNQNGFAASEEIRNALKDFKSGGKFILAYGEMMSQQAYAVANVADKVYLNPRGFFQWSGLSVEYVFFKGLLDKIEVEPQIFYAGKFKSATEPFRTDKMTPENQLQTSVWVNDLYDHLLLQTAEVRKLDTATLRRLANEGTIQTPNDAFNNKLVDSLKYDDQVKDEIKRRLGVDKYANTNFVTLNNYQAAKDLTPRGKGDKIALIVAEGAIMDGDGDEGMIGSNTYRTLIRKLRLDKSIKAIVFRINSGGGSSLASENIWRELEMAKQDKPVIVSFGNVAASGGYYVAAGADSIFAQPNTITGSIGVFSVIPNMEGFFKNKLGITFDGVQTGNYSDMGAVYRPLREDEKRMLQAGVELTYSQFKERVAEGRKKDTAFIDSIAQGRVWTGIRAKELGLIDRLGGLTDAIKSAAAKAELTSYQVKLYPEQQSVFAQLFGGKTEPINYAQKMREEIGEDNYKIYSELKTIKQMTGSIQTRLPFQFFVR